ncbi:hypothetical protein ACIPUB_17050 [Paeniglutamicibacter sp. ORCA_105]|uniref:hypothetical protein n=1 Tax=Paeniglutamicibacter sp. ORCA_105 TaxID=3377336 RepID=UPI0038959835
MRSIILGAAAGLAWSATMRMYMRNLVGDASRVNPRNTIVGIMLPGAITGAMLAHSADLRAADPERNLDRFSASPLVFAACTLPLPGLLRKLIETGEGSNAIATPLFGMAGGMVLAGRGPLWARIAAGTIVAGHIPLLAAMGPKFFMTSPPTGRERVGFAVNTLIYGACMAALAAACSIPLRRGRPVPDGQDQPQP